MILLQSVQAYVTKHLPELLKHDFTDVSAVKICKHYLEAIVFSCLNAKLLFPPQEIPDPGTALDRMEQLGLLSLDICRFFHLNEVLLSDGLPWQQEIPSAAVAPLYETLLQQDFQVTEKEAFYQTGKSIRDTAGAYYTPPPLAQALVDNLYRTCCQQRDGFSAAECSYADFSCGCGEFYQALLQVLCGAGIAEPADLCLRFWGTDIDPIALQIAVCSLLPMVPPARWEEVVSHFHLGNPLICTETEASYDEKVRLFAQGRYYAAAMGFSRKSFLFSDKFDIVVGNPPWEKIRFEERKFFKLLSPDISSISQKAEREKAIQALEKERPGLWNCYSTILSDYKAYSALAQAHPLLQNSLRGELNTYALFTDLALHALAPEGVLSLVVKSSLVTMPTYRDLFRAMARPGHLYTIFLFDNTKRIFSIDSREKFCILTAGTMCRDRIWLAAGLTDSKELRTCRRMSLDYTTLEKINPASAMVPNVSSTEALELLSQVHRTHPVFQEIYPECHFGRIVHLTNHASYIKKSPEDGYLPIYEGKFLYQYDARYSTFADMTPDQKYSSKASARTQVDQGALKPEPVSRYFIDGALWEKLRSNYPEPYALCWRSLSSPTNHRTMVAMILPMLPACQSVQMLQTPNQRTLLYLLGLFNSTSFDAFIRIKMPGIDLTQSVIRQIPVPDPNTLRQTIFFHGQTGTVEEQILWRVAALLSPEPWTHALAEPFFRPDLSFADARRELDELFILAYQLDCQQCSMLAACSGIVL